jgi:hypothetical protein
VLKGNPKVICREKKKRVEIVLTRAQNHLILIRARFQEALEVHEWVE